jgi:2-amino-4-hydroxy-6-hydroxymethyldihydropteridine diphosphokinase
LKTIYLSLGSNIGDRAANLRAAMDLLAAPDLRILRASPVYETEPVGCPGLRPQNSVQVEKRLLTRAAPIGAATAPQRWFLNLVVEAATELPPSRLLARTGKIERELGRIRTVRNGPRTIDIDILLYGDSVVRTVRLEIPHPRMAERRFVLAPLADLAPELRHPVTHRTVREMLEAAPAETVRVVDSDTMSHG